jgi:lysophospholipase
MSMKHRDIELPGCQDTPLRGQAWLPERAPRAVVVISHGLAEHGGRYAELARRLVDKGYAVYALDHRGHGRSGGVRANIDRFDYLISDLGSFIGRAQREHPATPVILLGHSMGGATTALWLAVDQPAVRGAILSGPVAATSGSANPLLRIFSIIGKLLPRLPFAKLASDDVSRDPDVVRRYDGDPLVYRGHIKAGLAAAMLRATQRTDRDADRIRTPILIMHGADDKLASPDGSKRLYERVGSRDRTLKLYDGLYHEILNEPEREDVLRDMLDWLDARLVASTESAAAAS